MPVLRRLFLSLSFFLGLGSAAHAACSWTTLANGTTANANQVMSNFDCLAPLNSPAFTGNVGIGTATPDAPLTIRGGIPTYGQLNIYSLGPSLTSQIDFLNSDASSRAWVELNPGLAVRVVGETEPLWLDSRAGSGAGYVAFHINGSEKARLANSGNFGIGTAAPSEALEVNGRIRVNALASASGTSLCINASVLSSCSSSRRYKEQIKRGSFGLKEVDLMRPVTFKWKGRDERDFGFIAEEVAVINPLFVTLKDGKIEGVKYPQLTAVLVGAIKEQQAEIAGLKRQNAILAKDLDAFSTKLSAATVRQSQEIRQLKNQMAQLARQRLLTTASN